MKCTKPTYHSVFYFVLGVLLGTGFILYFMGPNGNIETKDYLSLLGGVLMFLVACVAAWINYKHLEWQRESRIWESNKDLLFDLLVLLDEGEKYIKVELENRLILHTAVSSDDEDDPVFKELPDSGFLSELDFKLRKLELAYGCLLPADICDGVKSYFNNRDLLADKIQKGGHGWLDSYEDSIENYCLLKKSIQSVCSIFLGIDVTK